MHDEISNTAVCGAMTRGKRVSGDESRAAMKQIISEIQSGEFAREFIAENRAGGEHFDQMRKELEGTEIEEVGGDLREMMPWIETKV